MEMRRHCEVSLRGQVGLVTLSGLVCLLIGSQVGSSSLLCCLGRVT